MTDRGSEGKGQGQITAKNANFAEKTKGESLRSQRALRLDIK